MCIHWPNLVRAIVSSLQGGEGQNNILNGSAVKDRPVAVGGCGGGADIDKTLEAYTTASYCPVIAGACNIKEI